MTFALLNTHCSECGTAFEHTIAYPRKCVSCGKMKWDNPIPVAVALQPIVRQTGFLRRKTFGLAAAVRAIEPGKGKLGLIGGFMDNNDFSIEAAAAREFEEETSLKPASPPRLNHSMTNHRGNILAFCVIDRHMSYDTWLTGVACEENEYLDVLWENEWHNRVHEIAFPLHKDAIEKWFRGDLYRYSGQNLSTW